MKKAIEFLVVLQDDGEINVEDFYCVDLWKGEIHLQGAFSPAMKTKYEKREYEFYDNQWRTKAEKRLLGYRIVIALDFPNARKEKENAG